MDLGHLQLGSHQKALSLLTTLLSGLAVFQQQRPETSCQKGLLQLMFSEHVLCARHSSKCST